MIDHISIGVTDLERSSAFYERVLGTIELTKLIEKPGTVGFGKSYPEFWLNLRPQENENQNDLGFHICLRAKTVGAVNAFYSAAINYGATSDGEPGPRPEYSNLYFAAFIKDFDGNKIEVVTFVEGEVTS